MRSFVDDLRYAIRQMFKSPGFAAVAIITLALGIGANTAVFSVIDAVILRPLPYDKPERLISAQSASTQNSAGKALSYPDFFDWRSQNRTLEHLVSYHDNSFTLTGLSRPVHVEGEIVSWDLLPTLGVNPELGRGFTADEEKQGTQRRADQPRAVGRSVRRRQVDPGPHHQAERRFVHRHRGHAGLVSLSGHRAAERRLDARWRWMTIPTDPHP